MNLYLVGHTYERSLDLWSTRNVGNPRGLRFHPVGAGSSCGSTVWRELTPGCSVGVGKCVAVETSYVWKAKVSQSRPTLCNPVDYTVHGILQARIREWVAFCFCRGSSQPRDQTQVSHTAGRFSFFFFQLKFFSFFYCSGFCHTLKWNSHGFTCVPHPNPPSHLPLHPIPLGLPSAPGPSACLMHPIWAGDLFHPR